MNQLRIAAFSDAERGGNPTGVMISDTHPGEDEMRRIAAVFEDVNATLAAA